MRYRPLTIIFLTVMFLACQKTNVEDIAPLNLSLTIPIIRTEKLIDSLIQSARVDELYQILIATDSSFYDLYISSVLQITGDSARVKTEIIGLHTDTSYLQLYTDVLSKFSSMIAHEPAIAQAIQRFRELLEEVNAPPIEVYTFISGFALQSFLFETPRGEGLALGLDMFMGQDFPYASIDPGNPQFSSYLSRTYDPSYLASKAIDVLIEDRMAPLTKSDFLHMMIWGGIKLYAKDQILNFLPDSIVFEYTASQLEWCKNNEREMWNYFFEENLFYETDVRKFSKLVSPAPNSPGMPIEAPGQTGNYMGMQIVKAFMRRHPEISLSALLMLTDPQDILDQSKYKPPR